MTVLTGSTASTSQNANFDLVKRASGLLYQVLQPIANNAVNILNLHFMRFNSPNKCPLSYGTAVLDKLHRTYLAFHQYVRSLEAVSAVKTTAWTFLKRVACICLHTQKTSGVYCSCTAQAFTGGTGVLLQAFALSLIRNNGNFNFWKAPADNFSIQLVQLRKHSREMLVLVVTQNSLTFFLLMLK